MKRRPTEPSLDDIRVGARRASQRFDTWPAWKRAVSESTPPPTRRQDPTPRETPESMRAVTPSEEVAALVDALGPDDAAMVLRLARRLHRDR